MSFHGSVLTSGIIGVTVWENKVTIAELEIVNEFHN